jgi:hypothetical protein
MHHNQRREAMSIKVGSVVKIGIGKGIKEVKILEFNETRTMMRVQRVDGGPLTWDWRKVSNIKE